jgi:hypothetical protein
LNHRAARLRVAIGNDGLVYDFIGVSGHVPFQDAAVVYSAWIAGRWSDNSKRRRLTFLDLLIEDDDLVVDQLSCQFYHDPYPWHP